LKGGNHYRQKQQMSRVPRRTLAHDFRRKSSVLYQRQENAKPSSSGQRGGC